MGRHKCRGQDRIRTNFFLTFGVSPRYNEQIIAALTDCCCRVPIVIAIKNRVLVSSIRQDTPGYFCWLGKGYT